MGASSSALFRPLLEAELHVEKVFCEKLDQKLPEQVQRRIVGERLAEVSLLRDIDDCEGDRRAAMRTLRAQSDALLRPIFEHFDSKRRGVLDRDQFTQLVHAALIALRTELLDLLRGFLARKYQTIKYLHRMRWLQASVVVDLLQHRVIPRMEANLANISNKMWRGIAPKGGALQIDLEMTQQEFLDGYLDQSHALVEEVLHFFETYQPTLTELTEPTHIGLVV